MRGDNKIMQWDYDKIISYISYESKNVVFTCHADKADFEQDCLIRIFEVFKRKITVPYISVKWYIHKEINKYFSLLKMQKQVLPFQDDIADQDAQDTQDNEKYKRLEFFLKTGEYDTYVNLILANQPHNKYVKTIYVNYNNYKRNRNKFDYKKRKALNFLKHNISRDMGVYGI